MRLPDCALPFLLFHHVLGKSFFFLVCVGNSEDRFSHDAAKISCDTRKSVFRMADQV